MTATEPVFIPTVQAEAPVVRYSITEAMIAKYRDDIFDEFAENNKISPKAIKASRGEARASWAKLLAVETEILRGTK